MPARAPHALVIGGSRGIGLAIAQLLARNAYTLTLLSRSPTALSRAVDTLPNSGSAPAHTYIAGDITTPGFWSIQTPAESGPCFAALHKESGAGIVDADASAVRKIDVLVNCAGVAQSIAFARMEAEEIERVVQTNLTAVMVGTRFLLRNRYIAAKKKGTGEEEQGGASHSPVVINVASLLGLQGGFGAVAYAASKAGILGFTRGLATETGGLGVRVNAIVPGYIETDMTKGLDRAALVQRIPLRRFGTPEEVAQAALFLAQNEYAHNCVINLDGGLSAV